MKSAKHPAPSILAFIVGRRVLEDANLRGWPFDSKRTAFKLFRIPELSPVNGGLDCRCVGRMELAVGGHGIHNSHRWSRQRGSCWSRQRGSRWVRPATASFYRGRLAYTKPLWETPLTALRPDNIRHLLAQLRRQTTMGATSLHGVYRVLRTALRDAVKLALIDRNPCDVVRPPGIRRREMSTVPLERIGAIFEASQEPYRTVFQLMLYTGLRRGEALGLRRRDLDLTAGTATVLQQLSADGRIQPPKSEASRATVFLGDVTTAALQDFLRADDDRVSLLGISKRSRDSFVFCKLDGAPLRPDSVAQYWHRLMKRLGIEGVRLHDLRHTHATVLLAEGMDIRSVAARMRHTSAAFTASVYGHLLPGRHEQMIKAFEERIGRESANGLC